MALLALLLLFEEWLWDALTALGRKLGQWLHLQKLEAWLVAAPRHQALLAFLVPVALVTPLNLLALAWIAQGRIMNGIILQIIAKLLGTLLLARVFALTRAQLMTFGWFRALYTTITSWLSWARERIRASHAYRWLRRWREEARSWLARLRSGA